MSEAKYLRDSITVELANETMSYYYDQDREDRKLFVKNFGIICSQTREQVEFMELSDDDIVTIHFRGGHTIEVNVHLDSYTAIMRDVLKYIS